MTPLIQTRPSLPPGAYAAALASLPGVGPAWLLEALGRHTPERAWDLVLAGKLRPTGRGRPGLMTPAGREAAARLDVAELWARCRRSGIEVSWHGSPGYPSALLAVPSPAGVLFSTGKTAAFEGRPCAAVVGTRRCTPEGAGIAYQLGYDLSRAGVCVVSGLALGIDGAVHAGALAAVQDMAGSASSVGSTVGVAASGVDVVYPRQHRALWGEVARLGAIVSETPPGSPAQSWRFPSRNRLVAGLAQMVVVVECHASGGSWHTVEAALRQGIEVGAVPGSVLSSASVGTNTLLHEGATPVRDARDVLDVLGAPGPLSKGRPQLRAARSPAGSSVPRGVPRVVQRSHPAALAPLDEKVRAALSGRPLCLEEVLERSGLPVTAVVVALDRLEEMGLVTQDSGWWMISPHKR